MALRNQSPAGTTIATLTGRFDTVLTRKEIELLDDIFTLNSDTSPEDEPRVVKVKAQLNRSLSKRPASFIKEPQLATHSYTILSWLNAVRLFILRFNRFFLGWGFLEHSYLPAKFAYLGLSFILELLIDIGIILKSVFYDQLTPIERELGAGSISDRFWEATTKGARPYRMINAILWGAINLVSLSLAASTAIALNAIGFGLDVVHELYWLLAINNKFSKINQKLDGFLSENSRLITEAKSRIDTLKNGNQLLSPEASQIKLNINTYKRHDKRVRDLIKPALKKRWEADYAKQNETLIVISLVFVGMLLIYYPAAAGFNPYVATAIGATLTLVVGSIYKGLGRKLYNYWYPGKQIDTSRNTPSPPPQTPINELTRGKQSTPPDSSLRSGNSLSASLHPSQSSPNLASLYPASESPDQGAEMMHRSNSNITARTGQSRTPGVSQLSAPRPTAVPRTASASPSFFQSASQASSDDPRLSPSPAVLSKSSESPPTDPLIQAPSSSPLPALPKSSSQKNRSAKATLALDRSKSESHRKRKPL